MSATAADFAGAAGRAPARLVLRRWQMVALLAIAPALLASLYVGSNARASLAQRDLRASWESATTETPVEPATLATRTFAAGQPVARLGIAAIGLDLIVVEGGARTRRAPVHAPETVLPGLSGISLIEAGRFGNGNMFMHIGRLVAGDVIIVQTLAGVTRFVVRDVSMIPATAIDARRDATAPTLLLVAPARVWGSDERIVVRAEAGGGA